MKELAVSAAVSAILVVLEAVGIFISRWAVARRVAEERAYSAAAAAALKFDKLSAGKGGDPATAMAEQIRHVHAEARAQAFRKLVGSFVPGPELCYMSLTLQATLFIGFNYAAPAARKVMSPLLASSASAFPIMFGLFLLNFLSWIGSNMWREVIVEDLQQRFRKVSIFALISIGGGNLAATVYLVVANRL
jgi:hypothetical protein